MQFVEKHAHSHMNVEVMTIAAAMPFVEKHAHSHMSVVVTAIAMGSLQARRTSAAMPFVETQLWQYCRTGRVLYGRLRGYL